MPDPEVALNVTKEWQEDANRAFAERGRGAQKLCAKEVGCSEATVSQLLSGQIDVSEFVGAISDWLGIDRPKQYRLNSEEAEVLNLFQNTDDRTREFVKDLLRRSPNNKP